LIVVLSCQIIPSQYCSLLDQQLWPNVCQIRTNLLLHLSFAPTQMRPTPATDTSTNAACCCAKVLSIMLAILFFVLFWSGARKTHKDTLRTTFVTYGES
jgi:hypothetical protein